MLKKTLCLLLISSLFFCFSVTASARQTTVFGTEICKQYAELYYAGDQEALQKYADENMVLSGDGTGGNFSEEALQALRDQSDMLIVIDYEPFVLSQDSETADPKKDWAYCQFYFITADGNEYVSLYVLRESGTMIRSLKHIACYSGIEDSKDIVYASLLCAGNSIRVTDYQFCSAETGWNEVEGKYCYITSDGLTKIKSSTIKGVRYKFDENGVCQGKYTGFTKSDKGLRYWKNGKLVKNRLFKAYNGKYYSADGKGYLTAV